MRRLSSVAASAGDSIDMKNGAIPSGTASREDLDDLVDGLGPDALLHLVRVHLLGVEQAEHREIRRCGRS